MEQDWFLYSITLFTFIVIFTFCYIRHVFTYFERKRISSTTHPNFPFGNIYDVVFQKTPMFMQLWKFYNRFKRKNCKLGGFYVFLKPAVLIIDSQLTKAVLSADNNYFRDLDDANRSDLNGKLSDKILDDILKGIQEAWSKTTTDVEDGEVNFSEMVDLKLVEIGVREFFGMETEHFRHLNEKRMLGNFQKLVSMCYAEFGNFFKKFENKNKKLSDVVKRIDESRKSDDNDNVLQTLLVGGYSVSEIVDVMICLTDNLKKANNLVLFTLYELSINKEIQEDLRGEIKRFKKSKLLSSVSQLEELSYLETVIYETLRKYPLKPFVYKICTTDYNENNFNLSKDLLLFVSIFGIHHDAQNYVNAELFDPDRFSEENEKFIDSAKYLPFGGASKNDLDSRYVILLMKLALTELLLKFEFSLGKKSCKSLRFDESSFELKSKDDVWLKVKVL
ncbi:unnamed protein product [Tenebrio molitor]|nr:unnamed protein product [Tenebrio molitor]